MTESRLVDLELRFMKLERFVHELSDVVAGQGRTLDLLTQEIERLRAQPPGDDAKPLPNERPPHY
jgi:SlyX protein